MTQKQKRNTGAPKADCAREHPLNRLTARAMPWVWAPLAFIGVLLIVLGVLQNDLTAVFSKAAAICLECIGIG